MKRHWPILALVVLLAMVARRQSTLTDQREASDRLAAELQSLDERGGETGALGEPASLSQIDLAALRERASRVHRLRGEVTLAQQRFDHLEPVVAKLAAQLTARTNQTDSSPAPEFPPGYVPRHQFADRGTATPDAAVETFWWALGSGNFERFSQVVLEAQGPTHPNDAEAKQFASIFRRIPGSQIVSREIVDGGRNTVGLETAPDSQVFHLMLVSTNNQWWISMNQSESFARAIGGMGGPPRGQSR
jgi:hypothetical protein